MRFRRLAAVLLPLVALAATFLLLTSATLPSTLPPVEADAAKALLDSPRHGEWVTVNGPGTQPFQSWVVYPERATKAPVLVLIHEIFGLTDWARVVADRYAAEGFLVVAPDFLSGKAPDGKGGSAELGQDGARGAIAKLEGAEITARLNAAAAWGTSQPSATSAYGVVGYCWGGGISFGWATAQPNLKAAVVFYGTAPGKDALARIQAPVLGLFGGSDARVTSTAGPAQEELKRLGKRFEVEVYEGAGHGFLRQQGGQSGANLAAAQKSWPRSVEFLRAALEGTKTSDAPAVGSNAAFEDDCEECSSPTLVALN